MTLRRYAGRAAWLFLLLVVFSLVVGHVLGQPILLGYVTSSSMEPTIQEGAGFVSVPQAFAGDVEEGDVIVFEARELHDGGLTTHRVVEVREDGYVTKGDANPFTDQDGPEPLVRDQQVVATALQVGDIVVTIPHVGAVAGSLTGVAEGLRQSVASRIGLGALSSPRGFGFLLVGTGVGLFGLAALGGDGRRTRSRERRRDRPQVLHVWSALATVALVVVLIATTAMVLPAGVQEFGVASESGASSDPLVVEPGGSTELEYQLYNDGPVPTVVLLEARSEGVDVATDRVALGGRSSTTVTTTLSVPEEEGVHYRTVAEHRYFLLLPPSVLAALHAVHPLLAVLAVDAVLAGFVFLFGVALLGTGDLRLRPGRSLPLGVRLRRFVSQWL